MQLSHSSVFFYIQVPCIDMRQFPQRDSPIISQAYFSEQVYLVMEEGNWAYIETAADSYKGWVPINSLSLQEEPFFLDTSLVARVNRCTAHLYDREDTICGPILTLPFDSRLKVNSPKKDLTSRWIQLTLLDGTNAYIQRGDVTLQSFIKKKEELTCFSLQFLNLPYTWGGRSSFGYDCSGFVQMLYRQLEIYLPRDAKDQLSWEGFKQASLDDLQSGDLLFWGTSQNNISHVGMYLEQHRFIHATVAENAPYIRVSYLSDPHWNGLGTWPYLAARTLITK